jgi:septum formation protein
VDEAAIRAALADEGAPPRDMADALAEFKALKVSERNPGALVIGSDQILDLDGQALAKPQGLDDARAQLQQLRGHAHKLFSAVVIAQGGRPVWRHIGQARLTMRSFSDSYLDDYLARNWPDIAGSVGGYHIEAEGIRLFSAVEGAWPVILGMPLTEVLGYLALRGDIAS